MSAITRPSSILPPLRSSKPAADINGFFQIVGQALVEFIKTEGAPEGTVPVYVETFPKERLSEPDTAFDVILFHVVSGEMAPTSNDGATVPRSPMLRNVARIPSQAGYNLAQYGWWENYTVEFEVWSKSNSVANSLAVWFHRFLIRYAYYYKFFEAFGVQQFKFAGRQEDKSDEKENQELQIRRLRYSFRLEFLDTFTERQLTDLTLNFTIKRDVQTVELDLAQQHQAELQPFRPVVSNPV
jgi:hypothetical protein